MTRVRVRVEVNVNELSPLSDWVWI